MSEKLRSKVDFNDHLDDLMERLMNEDITSEELDKTVKLSKAVTEIAKVKLDEKRLKLDQFNSLRNAGFVPKQLGDDLKKSIGIENLLTQ